MLNISNELKAKLLAAQGAEEAAALVKADGQELTLLVTELTARYHTSQFISKYGSDEYYAHNADLLVHHRTEDLQERIQALDL